MIRNLASIFFVAFLLLGCQTTNPNLSQQDIPAISSMYIKGVVVKSFDQKVVVQVKNERPVKASDFENLLGQKVLDTTYLTEGSKTEIDGRPTKVLERRDELVVLKADKKYKEGDTVELYIPKKTMVVSDFNVKSSSKGKVGKLVFNNFAAQLSNSGRYVVVERDKLSEVLREHSLEMAGLTDSSQASFVGRILKAELLLTGSMEKVANLCIFNIRVIDVPTSKIIATVREETNCSNLQQLDIRDTGSDFGSFENGNEKGWLLGVGKNSYTSIDKTQGAEGSQQSLKMDFEIGSSRSKQVALISNIRKRDLSDFHGLTFYAKASKELVAALKIVDANSSDSKNTDGWVKNLQIGTEWEKFVIQFDDLVLSKPHARNFPGGDGLFNPDVVERIDLLVPEFKNKNVSRGSIWLDEIQLF